MGGVDVPVDLVVPMKRLDRAKSRLRGVLPGGVDGAGDAAHTELALALLLDTVTAATNTPGVRRLLVICEDVRVPAALASTGVDCVDVRGLPGLNAALRHAAGLVLARDPHTAVGALQADLPALRPAELAEAIAEAGGRRAFCADRQGTGTTLLLAAPGRPLLPRFGRGSAEAHTASGAVPIAAAVPSLRRDVDTPDDLATAATLGVGARTTALLRKVAPTLGH